MNNALALFEKELRHYFRSPIAYFIVAAFLLGTGLFFNFTIFQTGIASMQETFQSMGVLLLFVVPAITMRLFAAEYREGTMELLQTLPFKPWEVVLGKYLGAVAMLLLMCLCTLVDLIPLYLYGVPETSTIVAGYLGFILLGMASIAVGQLFSAFTENQIVAALLTVSVLLALWFIGYLDRYQGTAQMSFVTYYLSFGNHFSNFVIGLVRSESVIYFAAVSFGMLFLNARFLEWRR
jgi:ABC-2 type transport system permease protein